MRYHSTLFIFASLILLSVTAQSCTYANSTPIDDEVAALGYYSIFVTGWAIFCAFACFKKRDFEGVARRATLECTSVEQCLSYKQVPFCFNQSTYDFHTSDGTTGNLITGAYTLPDGQVGNLYTGPNPSNTAAAAALTTAGASAAAPVKMTANAASTVESMPTSASDAPSQMVVTSAMSPPATTIVVIETSGPATTTAASTTPKSEATLMSLWARSWAVTGAMVGVLGIALLL